MKGALLGLPLPHLPRPPGASPAPPKPLALPYCPCLPPPTHTSRGGSDVPPGPEAREALAPVLCPPLAQRPCLCLGRKSSTGLAGAADCPASPPRRATHPSKGHPFLKSESSLHWRGYHESGVTRQVLMRSRKGTRASFFAATYRSNVSHVWPIKPLIFITT